MHRRSSLLIGISALLAVTALIFRQIDGSWPPGLPGAPGPFHLKPGALPPGVIYRDERHLVLAEDTKVIIRTDAGVVRLDLEAGALRSVKRLWNKEAGELPLLGEAIADGLKLTAADRAFLVQTAPTVTLLAAYPDPQSKEDKIIIDKSRHRLYYYRRGELAKTYPVATGRRPEYTPEGTFTIANKIGHPLPGDPEGRFGPRWMGLAVPGTHDHRRVNDPRAPVGQKYGIHGTNEPDSIGTDASGGCIRLRNEDVVELFELAAVGTPVEIRR